MSSLKTLKSLKSKTATAAAPKKIIKKVSAPKVEELDDELLDAEIEAEELDDDIEEDEELDVEEADDVEEEDDVEEDEEDDVEEEEEEVPAKKVTKKKATTPAKKVVAKKTATPAKKVVAKKATAPSKKATAEPKAASTSLFGKKATAAKTISEGDTMKREDLISLVVDRITLEQGVTPTKKQVEDFIKLLEAVIVEEVFPLYSLNFLGVRFKRSIVAPRVFNGAGGLTVAVEHATEVSEHIKVTGNVYIGKTSTKGTVDDDGEFTPLED